MIIVPVDMPKDCHECDAMGISDIVGVDCDRGALKSDEDAKANCQLIEVDATHRIGINGEWQEIWQKRNP